MICPFCNTNAKNAANGSKNWSQNLTIPCNAPPAAAPACATGAEKSSPQRGKRAKNVPETAKRAADADNLTRKTEYIPTNLFSNKYF